MKKNSWNALAVTTLVAAILVTQLTRAAFDSGAAAPKGDVQVVRVTPQGKDVPPQRQIVVTFDRPMKPLGDMSVTPDSSPVVIAPALPCNWHWLDPRSLACELPSERPLVPAVDYELTVRAGIQAQDGNTLREAVHAGFSTERPKIKQYSFYSWQGPGTPEVLLVFNQPVSRDSVAAHVHFTGQPTSVVKPVPYEPLTYRVFPL